MPRSAAHESILVGAHFQGVVLSRLLDAKDAFTPRGEVVKGKGQVRPADGPVLDSRTQPEPGRLYPAQHDPDLRYYLPDYQVAASGADPAVELEFLGDAAEAGRLTVTLTWSVPEAADVEVRTMDHTVDLALAYQTPVRDETGRTTGTVPQKVALQPPVPAGTRSATSTTTFPDRSAFQAVYQAMRDPDFQASLALQLRARVGVRTWRQVPVFLPKLEQVRKALDRDVAITRVLQREDTAKVSLKQVMSHKPVRVRVRDHRDQDATKAKAKADAKAKVTARARARGRGRGKVTTGRVRDHRLGLARVVHHTLDTTRLARVAPPALTSTVLARAGVRVGAVAAPAPAPPAGRRSERVVSDAVASSILQGALKDRFLKVKDSVATSDFTVAQRKVIPVQIAVDRRSRPAVIQVDVSTSLDLPFVFPPTEHPSVYTGADDYDGALRFLIRRAITQPDGSTVTVLQDSVLEHVVHLPPTRFRLGREDTSPYLPRIRFVLSEVATTDEDADTEVLFLASVVYELEPWTDPSIIEAVRFELAKEGLNPTFVVVAPTQASYVLDGEERSEAQIDPEEGIRDVLDLDAGGFSQLSHNLADAGVGGRVTFTLFDGSEAHAEARLSFREESSDLVDTIWTGHEDGRSTVTVRNRTESPVTITGLPAVLVTPTARAVPLDASSVVGTRLAPLETLEVHYQVDDPDLPLTDLAPTVLALPDPDVQRLCAALIEGLPGYSSLSFTVPLVASDGAFAVTGDPSTQLTGLLVEFDDGSTATLTPDDPDVEAVLVGRLLDQIFADDDEERDQRFFYRVTNLHLGGEGARSAWQEGRGTSTLAVGVALGDVVAELPF